MLTRQTLRVLAITRIVPVVAVCTFAVVATMLWLGTQAATPPVDSEVEYGAISAPAVAVNATGASAGTGVRFGREYGTLTATKPEGNPHYVFRMFGGNDDPARIPAASRKNYDVYLLSPSLTRIATAVKAANQNAVVYMYKDASSARGSSPTAYGPWCSNGGSTIGRDWGVDYCDAYANHAAWFMTKGGSKFEYTGYQYHWHMDVAAAGYKEQWAANVLADLRNSDSWDGVFVDNVLADARAYVPGGAYPDQYSSLTAGQDAYASFMEYVGQHIRAAGYGVIGNNNGVRLYPGLWDRYTQATSGGYDEFWTTFGGTASAPNNLPLYSGVGWEAQVAEVESAAHAGKLTIATGQDSGGGCVECTRYGLASYLLSNDGLQAYQAGNVDNLPGDYVSANAMFTWNLGSATSGRTQPQTNLFERTFSGGLVLVNADSSASRTVTLPKPYLDENGASVTSVSVGALRGRILRTP